ncbi:ComF family protein [Candidatus Enterococcus willemsii]|uniref:Amidophosphoribosyltransferase n=1 Tax=Candidatus Enterococcus willemsii TaxID=1857215 RepID=A0ABQ6Z1R9_9ENTE|nr:phosphoribosyltransferase family protein [Enterococcus sp. CU12B]KAF1305489.1 amidophosphoribosyltransferase [Enterococcus sp. CU12B]
MKCSWCQKEIIRNLQMKEILFPWCIREERCQLCAEQFVPIPEKCCPYCCKEGTDKKCQECERWQQQYPDYIFKHHAFFQYNEGFKEWIYQYKKLGNYQLKQTFVTELVSYFKYENDVIVTAIPLSDTRFSERGFNQVTSFLDAANIKTTPLLIKKEHTSPQAEKNRQERLATKQPFEATAKAKDITNRTVIIVDDVYTTGRTLFHAAEILLPYNPREIRTLSLAR